MNCDDLNRHLYEYFEHKLDPARRASLDAHAKDCPKCGELLRTAGELSCQELADFLMEYVEGTLEAERRKIFERHLGLCPPCVDFLESYKRTIELTGEACGACDEEPPAIPPGLVRAILAARERPEQKD